MARGRGRTIDFKEWDCVPSVNANVSTATTTLFGGLAFLRPSTILRARGYVQASFDATVQVGDLIRLTFGLGIVSDDAFNLGATAMPDPAGECEYPWLWWGEMLLRSELAAGPGSWGIPAQRLEVDTKAMRRVKPQQTLAWIVESTDVAGAPVTNVDCGQLRVLIGS